MPNRAVASAHGNDISTAIEYAVRTCRSSQISEAGIEGYCFISDEAHAGGSYQLAEGNGFFLCKRARQAIADLRVLMLLTNDRIDVELALESGAMAVVCEEDFFSPEMEVMQSLLAAANTKHDGSGRARSRLPKPAVIIESPSR